MIFIIETFANATLFLSATHTQSNSKCVSETFKRIIKPFAVLFTEDTFNSLN